VRPWWVFPLGEQVAPQEEIRRDLVNRVRREIASGDYDTPEKWEEALDRLYDDLKDF
jgi:hypothetical protein